MNPALRQALESVLYHDSAIGTGGGHRRTVHRWSPDTWRTIRHELDRMHLVTLATPAGQVAERTAITAGQKTIWDGLDLPEPPRSSTSPPQLSRSPRSKVV